MLFDDKQTFIIAEIASSHEGRPELALRLAKAAAQSGADAVKFQIFHVDELVVAHHPKADSFRQIQLSASEWKDVMTAARKEGLHILADVYDMRSLELAEEAEVEGYKVSTTIVRDRSFLVAIAATGKPILLSVSSEGKQEIQELITSVEPRAKNALVLVHGFQGFPTRLEDTHLRRLLWLGERFNYPVGFADHSPANLPVAMVLPVVAVGLGACLIEKHLTWDRGAKGRDHVSALNPDEFERMVKYIRDIEITLGKLQPDPSEAEMLYRETMQKKVVASSAVVAGTLLTPKHLTLKRTVDDGVGAEVLPRLIGRKLTKPLSQDDAVVPDWLTDPVTVILIAVRMKSNRLPRKALLPVCGKPVLEHLVDRISKAKIPKRTVLCTSTNADDRVLLGWAARLGVGVYAGSEDDVMDRFLKAAQREDADVVVRVTGDNPLTDPESIDQMVQHHLRTGADYTYTEDLPRGTRCEVISVGALRRAHDLAEEPRHSEYMTYYFRDYPQVFNLSRWEAPELLCRPNYRLTIDTPEDLELMRRIYETLYHEGEVFPLTAVVRLLDSRPEWLALNSNIKPTMPHRINTKLRRGI